MQSRAARQGRTWLAAVAASLVLGVAAPRPGAAFEQLKDLASADDPFAPLIGVVSLVAWAAALWLAVSVLVTLAGECPGWTGRIGRALSRRIVPATVRRTLQLSLGLTVAVGALGATTASATAPPVTAPPVTAATSSAAAPSAGSPSAPGPLAASLDWPTTGAVPSTSLRDEPREDAPSAAAATPPPSATPSATPSVAPAPSALASVGTPTSTLAPAPAPTDASGPEPPTAPAVPDRPSPATSTSATSVRVEAGDSLWSISRAHLESGGASATPADIAGAWPQWWEANRQLVGDDPDLLLPGTQLTPPTSARS